MGRIDAEPGEMGEEGEEKRRRIEEMKRVGGEVMEMRGDVTKEDEMRAVVERTCERWGRIDGWIHAAGSGGEKALRLMQETDDKDCKEQYLAKAYGAYVLENVLQGKDIDFCLLMSSNASVLGGLGSFSYSSANIFMDEFANNRSESSGTRWISANWDGWLTEGDKQLNTSFQTSLDQFAMTPGESTEAFRRIVVSKIRGQIVVSTGDLSQRLDLWIRSGGSKQPGGSNGSDQVPVPFATLAAHRLRAAGK